MDNSLETKIQIVKSEELDNIKKDLAARPEVFVAEINGEEIQSWTDYILEISKKFDFPPSPHEENIDGYLDWIRDLSWLEKDGYVFIINQYEQFLKNDLELRQTITDCFVNYILPFWKKDIESSVVEGKAKPFTVYLVI